MTSVNDFYQRGTTKGASLLPAPNLKVGEGGASWVSPSTGEPIPFKEARIKSGDVRSRITKCLYNKRDFSRLTPNSVSDIIPSIKEAKINRTPVVAVKRPDGIFEVITGLRRSYAVSLCEDAELLIHYAESMSDADKQVLCNTSDLYNAPSLIDFGFTLLEYKTSVGAEYSVRKAASVFGVDKSYISHAEFGASLPEALLSLYPSLDYISRRFVMKLMELKCDQATLVEAIDGLEPVSSSGSFESVREEIAHLKKLSTALSNEIISRIKSKKSPNNSNKPLESEWLSAKFVDGVETKVTKKGVVINLNKLVADSEVGKQLLRLLSEINE